MATACSTRFEDDPDLLIADIHEDGRYLYPGTGAATETGRARRAAPSSTCRCRRVRTTTTSSGLAAGRGIPRAASPNSSCSSAVPTASTATRSRICAFTEEAHAQAAAALCAIADELGHGRVVGMGGGGYNRRNLARAWTRVVEAFVAC